MSRRQKRTAPTTSKVYGRGKQTANREPQPEDTEQRPLFDNSKFTSIENEAWCRDRSLAHILVERDVSSVVEDRYHLRGEFQKLGWEGVLSLPDVYYVDLVREFYANIPEKQAKRRDLDRLDSWVRGKKILVMGARICDLLKAPKEGEHVDLKKSFVAPTPWKIEEAAARLGVTWAKRGNQNKLAIKTSLFTPQHRLLINLFASNVIPKVSGTDEARTSDMYFLDQIFREVGRGNCCILGEIIVKHMWTVARGKANHALPYARLLTLIFRSQGVPLDGIPSRKVTSKDAVGTETCRKLQCPLTQDAMVEGETHEAQAEEESQQEQDTEAHEARAEGGASTSHAPPPPPPRNTRPGWQRVLEQITSFEERITSHITSLDARVQRIEEHLGLAAHHEPPPS